MSRRYRRVAVLAPMLLRQLFFRLAAPEYAGRALAWPRRLKQMLRPRHYAAWIARYDRLTGADRRSIAAAIASMQRRPLISILLRANGDPAAIAAAAASVTAQLYPHWELIVTGSDGTAAGSLPQDIRIKLPRDGQAALSLPEAAASIAEGELILALDAGDRLAPDALYLIAAAAAGDPPPDLLFSDEDHMDADGVRRDPWLKCRWNEDLMLSQNAVGRLAAYRRSVLAAIEGAIPEDPGAADYELALRCRERTDPARIRHLPFVLYHRGTAPSKPGSGEGDRAAVRAHLRRRGLQAEVTAGDAPGVHRVRWPLPAHPPKVDIIIPTKDKADLLDTAVRSILERTDYPDFGVVIVENGSREAETFRCYEALGKDPRVRVLAYDRPYSYAAINNWAAARTDAPLIALLNNDTEVIGPGWLAEMASQALRPEIGAVGAKLYYPDDRMQHAGIVLGLAGTAGHPHLTFERSAAGYFGRAISVQRFSAVTAACMLLRRSVFEAVGGFDERHFAVAFNDVDLCLRIGELGFGILWTPYAELYHYESASLGPPAGERLRQFERESARFRARWAAAIADDPCYNPNLSVDIGDFSLAFPPRVQRPWKTHRT